MQWFTHQQKYIFGFYEVKEFDKMGDSIFETISLQGDRGIGTWLKLNLTPGQSPAPSFPACSRQEFD
jgi:hypothetical protein